MKRLNYEDSTVEEIAQHWLNITRQSVSIMRKNYANNIPMHSKLEAAYKLYRTMLLQRQIDSLSSIDD